LQVSRYTSICGGWVAGCNTASQRPSSTTAWTIVSVREPESGGATLPAKSLIQQEMIKRGILFNGSNFISYALTEADVDAAIDAYGAAFQVLASALPEDVLELLEGPPLTPAFRVPS
jgi:glutamate-1-semialdehyde 2,1-aminomutase